MTSNPIPTYLLELDYKQQIKSCTCYVIANNSGDRELAYRASNKREALAWIKRTTANWLGAPVFTIEAKAPPCAPQWFDYSVQ